MHSTGWNERHWKTCRKFTSRGCHWASAFECWPGLQQSIKFSNLGTDKTRWRFLYIWKEFETIVENLMREKILTYKFSNSQFWCWMGSEKWIHRWSYNLCHRYEFLRRKSVLGVQWAHHGQKYNICFWYH